MAPNTQNCYTNLTKYFDLLWRQDQRLMGLFTKYEFFDQLQYFNFFNIPSPTHKTWMQLHKTLNDVQRDSNENSDKHHRTFRQQVAEQT
jgi:hypothetical protein